MEIGQVNRGQHHCQSPDGYAQPIHLSPDICREYFTGMTHQGDKKHRNEKFLNLNNKNKINSFTMFTPNLK